MQTFSHHDWYWLVGGDESRAWSSAFGSYVTEWSPDRVTRIASEAELNEVLEKYGLCGPLITAAHVRAEAQRRIIAITGATDLTHCLIKQLNAQMRAAELLNKKTEGVELTAAEQAEEYALHALADAIKAIRAKSNVLEALDPIPADFRDNHHWS